MVTPTDGSNVVCDVTNHVALSGGSGVHSVTRCHSNSCTCPDNNRCFQFRFAGTVCIALGER
jgi:hypothetical protein